MQSEASSKVFYNDYIMSHILRMLGLKQQYVLQSICQRFRFLIIKYVWAKDYKEIQMNSIRMGSLTAEEFFDFLHLNADNVTKLNIHETDGCNFEKYMTNSYIKLLELRIKGFSLDDRDFFNIYTHCPALQHFCYEKSARFSFRNEKSYKNDIWSLARSVPLLHLELCNIPIWKNVRTSLDKLKTLKTFSSFLEYCPETEKLLENCPNLKELELIPSRSFRYDICAKYKQLEIFKLSRFITLEIVWHLLKHKKLKVLVLDGFIDLKSGFKFGQNVNDYGKSLESLKVYETVFSNADANRQDIWLPIFHSPSTNFENLQELCLRNQQTNDALINEIAFNCPALRILRLYHCAISGRYINQIPKLETLDLQDISLPMSSTNFRCIVNDLKFLQCLKLYQQDFSWDESTTEESETSIIELEVYVKGQQISCMPHILKYCKAPTLSIHIDGATIPMDILQTLFAETESLHTMELRKCIFSAKDNGSIGTLPLITHLLLFDCEILLKWPCLLETVMHSKVETVQIFDTPIYDAHFSCPLETDMDVLKHLHSIAIPYDLFRKKLRFWQWCFEESIRFQLCCYGHNDHRHVLSSLFDNSSIIKNDCITSIQVNVELTAVKYFCGEMVISVAWLNYKEIEFANRFLCNETMIILIKK